MKFKSLFPITLLILMLVIMPYCKSWCQNPPTQAFPNIPNLLEYVEHELKQAGKPAITMFEFSSQIGATPININDYMEYTLPYVGGFHYQHDSSRYNDFISKIAEYNSFNKWNNLPLSATFAVYLYPKDIYHWEDSYRAGTILNLFIGSYDVIFDYEDFSNYSRLYIPPKQVNLEADLQAQTALQNFKTSGGKVLDTLYELVSNPFVAVDFERTPHPVHAYWISGSGQGSLNMQQDNTIVYQGNLSEKWQYTLPATPNGNYPMFDLRLPNRDLTGLLKVGGWFYFDITGPKTGYLINLTLLRPDLSALNLNTWFGSGEGAPNREWVYHEWNLPEGMDLEEVSYIRMTYHAGDGWQPLANNGQINIFMDNVTFTFEPRNQDISYWTFY